MLIRLLTWAPLEKACSGTDYACPTAMVLNNLRFAFERLLLYLELML